MWFRPKARKLLAGQSSPSHPPRSSGAPSRRRAPAPASKGTRRWRNSPRRQEPHPPYIVFIQLYDIGINTYKHISTCIAYSYTYILFIATGNTYVYINKRCTSKSGAVFRPSSSDDVHPQVLSVHLRQPEERNAGRSPLIYVYFSFRQAASGAPGANLRHGSRCCRRSWAPSLEKRLLSEGEVLVRPPSNNITIIARQSSSNKNNMQ